MLYAYGAVRPEAPIAHAPRGLDDSTVTLHAHAGQVAVLVSSLDAAVYASDAMETRAADVEWVGPRAVAHDAVLSWASDLGGVVPFPMFTLFASPESLRGMLRERGRSLDALLDRVSPSQEWTVRLFRLDDRAAAALSLTSPAMAEIARRAGDAAPGQRYLLERKADELTGAELRRVSGETAREAFTALSALGEQSVRDALPAAPSGARPAGVAVLDASFLVRRDRADAFRSAAAQLAGAVEPRGFRVELSGPWPPYHFVRDDA